MRSLEHTSGIGGAADAETYGQPISMPEVQGALMLMAYREAHKNDQHPPKINLADLEANDADIQVGAMNEWIAGEEQSSAARFRAYADAHPHMRVQTHNEQEISELLIEVSRGMQTLH
jgi:hypothetical protein